MGWGEVLPIDDNDDMAGPFTEEARKVTRSPQ